MAFPLETLGADVLAEILRGGAAAAAEAGVAIVGGHSIDDAEPKYGMAVTGVVHPDRLIRNSTARPRRRAVPEQARGRRRGVHGGQARAGVARAAGADRGGDDRAEPRRRGTAAIEAGASAMTDVTGYGLLGHA